MKIAGSLLALLLLCSLGFAQTPYFETFEVRLHNLEVVVTDPKGNPVRGLTKDDFIVLESGKPQTITNFSVYDGGTAAASSVNAETPKAAEPVAEAAPVQSPRRFIFFVDDMAVRAVARKPLIKNAVALVDQLQPGDLATVVRPTGANRIAIPFTSDTAAVRTALTKAIESCVLNFASPGQGEVELFVNAMENARSAKERKFARSEYITRSRQRIQQRLAQLRAVIGSTAGLDGRKVLVLITSGLSAQPGRESIPPIEQMRMGLDDGEKKLQAAERVEAALFQDDVPQGDTTMQEQASTAEFVPAPNLNPLIDELGRAAAANGVTIYALEPEVPLDLSARKTTAGSRTVGSLQSSSFVGGSTIVQSVMYDEMQHYRGQTLTSLTEKTGGKWFRGTSNIDDVFHQIASDMSVYYSLAYRATGDRDKARRVEVKVRNRPELIVRTRSEVIDRSPEREMADQVLASLLFPNAINELQIHLITGTPVKSGRHATIPLEVVIPVEKLTFLQTAGGSYVATIDVHHAVAAEKSDFTNSGRRRQTIQISAEQYAARAGRNYRFKSGVEVPHGPLRIAIGVMDTASHLAGFQNANVTP